MSETTTPLNVTKRTPAGALIVAHWRTTSGTSSSEALAPGLPESPEHNLRFRGGQTIRKLTYISLHVGGQAAWAAGDIQNIDGALAAAMTDRVLVIVINPYFDCQGVSTTPIPPRVLPGPQRRTGVTSSGLSRPGR